MLVVWMLKKKICIVCYKVSLFFIIILIFLSFCDYVLLLTCIVLPKELQIELEQLCPVNALIYQPLCEMTQVLYLSYTFNSTLFLIHCRLWFLFSLMPANHL